MRNYLLLPLRYRWLYDRCQRTSEREDATGSALDYADKVYDIIEQSRVNLENGTYNKSVLTGRLFTAIVRLYKRSNVDREFVFEIMDEMEEMAESTFLQDDLIALAF
jgi:hypothetical protein